MKVLVTGATGYMGSVVVEKLIERGHEALGFVRSEAAARIVQRLGCEPVAGDLTNPASLFAAASSAEAVIHTGLAGGSGGETFNPDIAFPADQRAVETIIEALKGSSRRFVHVSGGMAVGVLTPPGSAPSPVHTEETPFVAPEFMRRRVDTEQTALAGITHGVHSVVLRPPHVYGRGGSFALPILLDSARRHAVSAHVGEGSNIWAMVHVDDLAELFVLALERAPAGHLFHTATSEVTAREVAESIARAHDLPVAPWTLEQAAEQWGAAAATILAASERTDSAKARALLGWAPRGPSVTDEIERGSYTPVREAA